MQGKIFARNWVTSSMKRSLLTHDGFFFFWTRVQGGTLAPSGGYIIGKAVYVKAARHRLSAPGVDGGATLGKTR